MRSRFRPSHGTVVAYLALFVALGGTTYAATGGNFILGKPNTAAAPTQLKSGTGNDSGTLKVTNSAASGGRAIQGTSTNGQGVYGHSYANAGVVGDSTNFDGVYAASNSGRHAAVSAHNEVFRGYGLWASGGSVHNHTAAVHGQSEDGNGVEGISTAPNAAGVLGSNGHGWAVQALGNTSQNRTANGFVKAMALVRPNAADPIKQCFNSQRPASQATSGDCGITFNRNTVGVYAMHFGFQTSDRFIQAQQVDINFPGQAPLVAFTHNAGSPDYSTDDYVGLVSPGDTDFYIFVY